MRKLRKLPGQLGLGRVRARPWRTLRNWGALPFPILFGHFHGDHRDDVVRVALHTRVPSETPLDQKAGGLSEPKIHLEVPPRQFRVEAYTPRRSADAGMPIPSAPDEPHLASTGIPADKGELEDEDRTFLVIVRKLLSGYRVVIGSADADPTWQSNTVCYAGHGGMGTGRGARSTEGRGEAQQRS